ncbi:MAG TPA: hypothetical protein VFZ61_05870 [Polyangiales bacterium]
MPNRAASCLIPLLFLACSSNKPASSAEPTPAAPAPAPAAAAPAAAPSAPATPSGAPAAGGLTWTPEAPLKAREPKSRMRAAEYGVEGDPTAELSVFYFGAGQGGAVDANITRWLGQLSQPDGSDTSKVAKRSERTVGALKVTLVEATGTFSGGMAMPGAPAAEPQTGAMMLGAIAEGGEGPVFFKLVGKREAIESARAAFDALIGSLRPAS